MAEESEEDFDVEADEDSEDDSEEDFLNEDETVVDVEDEDEEEDIIEDEMPEGELTNDSKRSFGSIEARDSAFSDELDEAEEQNQMWTNYYKNTKGE